VRRRATTIPPRSARQPPNGEAWDEFALDGFLANPRAYFPGTSMAFRGIRSAEDRADLIAYLMQEGGSSEDPAEAETGPSEEVAAILEIEGDVAYGRFLSSECTAPHVVVVGGGAAARPPRATSPRTATAPSTSR
jgi:cytochrome c2